MNSNFDFDLENGPTTLKYPGVQFLQDFEEFEKWAKMRSKGYIRGPRVIFNSFVFCHFGELLSDFERNYGFNRHFDAHKLF